MRRRKQLRAVGLQAAVAQSNACMLINRTAARADCGMDDEYRIGVLIWGGVAISLERGAMRVVKAA